MISLSTIKDPFVGKNKPKMIFTNVVFPLPDGPIMPILLNDEIFKLIFFKVGSLVKG